jgi:hypothetical protein
MPPLPLMTTSYTPAALAKSSPPLLNSTIRSTECVTVLAPTPALESDTESVSTSSQDLRVATTSTSGPTISPTSVHQQAPTEAHVLIFYTELAELRQRAAAIQTTSAMSQRMHAEAREKNEELRQANEALRRAYATAANRNKQAQLRDAEMLKAHAEAQSAAEAFNDQAAKWLGLLEGYVAARGSERGQPQPQTQTSRQVQESGQEGQWGSSMRSGADSSPITREHLDAASAVIPTSSSGQETTTAFRISEPQRRSAITTTGATISHVLPPLGGPTSPQARHSLTAAVPTPTPMPLPRDCFVAKRENCMPVDYLPPLLISSHSVAHTRDPASSLNQPTNVSPIPTTMPSSSPPTNSHSPGFTGMRTLAEDQTRLAASLDARSRRLATSMRTQEGSADGPLHQDGSHRAVNIEMRPGFERTIQGAKEEVQLHHMCGDYGEEKSAAKVRQEVEVAREHKLDQERLVKDACQIHVEDKERLQQTRSAAKAHDVAAEEERRRQARLAAKAREAEIEQARQRQAQLAAEVRVIAANQERQRQARLAAEAREVEEELERQEKARLAAKIAEELEQDRLAQVERQRREKEEYDRRVAEQERQRRNIELQKRLAYQKEASQLVAERAERERAVAAQPPPSSIANPPTRSLSLKTEQPPSKQSTSHPNQGNSLAARMGTAVLGHGQVREAGVRSPILKEDDSQQEHNLSPILVRTGPSMSSVELESRQLRLEERLESPGNTYSGDLRHDQSPETFAEPLRPAHDYRLGGPARYSSSPDKRPSSDTRGRSASPIHAYRPYSGDHSGQYDHQMERRASGSSGARGRQSSYLQQTQLSRSCSPTRRGLPPQRSPSPRRWPPPIRQLRTSRPDRYPPVTTSYDRPRDISPRRRMADTYRPGSPHRDLSLSPRRVADTYRPAENFHGNFTHSDRKDTSHPEHGGSRYRSPSPVYQPRDYPPRARSPRRDSPGRGYSPPRRDSLGPGRAYSPRRVPSSPDYYYPADREDVHLRRSPPRDDRSPPPGRGGRGRARGRGRGRDRGRGVPYNAPGRPDYVRSQSHS